MIITLWRLKEGSYTQECEEKDISNIHRKTLKVGALVSFCLYNKISFLFCFFNLSMSVESLWHKTNANWILKGKITLN